MIMGFISVTAIGVSVGGYILTAAKGGLLISVSGVGEETLLEHRLHLSVDILAGVAQFLVEHLVWG